MSSFALALTGVAHASGNALDGDHECIFQLLLFLRRTELLVPQTVEDVRLFHQCQVKF